VCHAKMCAGVFFCFSLVKKSIFRLRGSSTKTPKIYENTKSVVERKKKRVSLSFHTNTHTQTQNGKEREREEEEERRRCCSNREYIERESKERLRGGHSARARARKIE
jgi:hypothetical protein